MSASEIEDRRQRAREAGYDAASRAPGYCESRAAIEAASGAATQVEVTPELVTIGDTAIEAAIEAATRVKITGEVIEAAWDAQPVAAQQAAEIDLDDMRRIVAAALAALGFEVIE